MLRRTSSVGAATARAIGTPMVLGWREGLLVVAGRATARTCTLTSWALGDEGPGSPSASVTLPAANPRFVREVDDAHVLVVRDASIAELWSSEDPAEPRWSSALGIEPGAVQILGEHAIVVGEDGEVVALALDDGRVRRLLASVRVEPAIAVDGRSGRFALATQDGALVLDALDAEATPVQTQAWTRALAFASDGALVLASDDAAAVYVVARDGSVVRRELPSRARELIAHPRRQFVVCLHRDHGPTLLDLSSGTATELCPEIVVDAAFDADGNRLALAESFDASHHGIRTLVLDRSSAPGSPLGSMIAIVPVDDAHSIACDRRRVVSVDWQQVAVTPLPRPPVRELWGLVRGGADVFVHGFEGLWQSNDDAGWLQQADPCAATPRAVERIAIDHRGTSALVGLGVETRGSMAIERWSRGRSIEPWQCVWRGPVVDAASALVLSADAAVAIYCDGDEVVIDDGGRDLRVEGEVLHGAVVCARSIALGLDHELVVVDRTDGRLRASAAPLRWIVGLGEDHLVGYANGGELRIHRTDDLAVVARHVVTDLGELVCAHATATRLVVASATGMFHAFEVVLAEASATPRPSLEPGVGVRVCSGSYRGARGKVVGRRGDEVDVEIDLFGLPTQVVLAASALEIV